MTKTPVNGKHLRSALSPGRPLFGCLLALILCFGGVSPVASDGIWGYVIGEKRSGQQANFCDSEEAVHAIAEVFRSKGARPGYEALRGSSQCTLRVEDFVPRLTVTTVTISAGEPDEYTVSFLLVELKSGAETYLVTTRPVSEGSAQ